MKEQFKKPHFKKHLKHFKYVQEDENHILIKYNGATFDEICKIIGCTVMGEDPYFTFDVSERSVETALEIYALPPWERQNISKLFEYFLEDCPKIMIRKLIGEE